MLIANRGIISRRIARTLKRLGVGSVAVYSEADAHALHVADADEAVLLGPAPAAESYLKVDRILAAAKETGAEAIHPGYGFLSGDADFAEACERAGFVYIGPTPEQVRCFGLKHKAREIAEAHGVPVCPGVGLLAGAEDATREAMRVGFPVMLKSTAGRGGIGMRVCRSSHEVAEAFASVDRLSRSNFKETGIYLEKFIPRARHIEVQIFGDGKGRVLALGERDCSVQRRNQKIIEETPAPGLSDMQRAGLLEAAIKLGQAVNYRSAGTVEFVFDVETGSFYFLELNARLQVEHGITEEVTGVDLVEWMVRLAAGESSFLDAHHGERGGHSIQVRIYAEDANKNFQPSCGILTEVGFPEDARCETWVQNGAEVTPFYDPMLAKIIVRAPDRGESITRMKAALDATVLGGIESNLDYLRQVIATPEFAAGTVTTGFLGQFTYAPRTIDVLDAGAQTTVQDYPGRLGFLQVGAPHSGPMDPLAFRFANRLVGNPESAAGLEITMTGPTLRFNSSAKIAIAGADMQAELNGLRAPRWKALDIEAGDVLQLRGADGPGCRAYLAVRGGFQTPLYLGSRSTFTPGDFGGHGGRALRLGDVLHLGEPAPGSPVDAHMPQTLIPIYTNAWEIGVLYGPHGAPDFFTKEDIAMLFGADWKVHSNSNRAGIRLIGPKPRWARAGGGEAGLDPAEIHENACSAGANAFTGDMPTILGPDGPTLGGFVCPACVTESELWKIGQLRPGDTVRFRPMPMAEAGAREREQDSEVQVLLDFPDTRRQAFDPLDEDAVQYRLPEEPGRAAVCYRRAGDRYLLVEYGPPALDLGLRFKVHALAQWLEAKLIRGVIDFTPGGCSLQIHYDPRSLPLSDLMGALLHAEGELPDLGAIEIPSRIVHLPLSWNDPSIRPAMEESAPSTRPGSFRRPSDIEFIQRINGLESVEDVKRMVFDASYLVLGLGDAHPGSPAAAALDPRHRLVAAKRNPAGVWTPENAVGIGGGTMRIHGLEGLGDSRLVGRTVQIWNTYRVTQDFDPGKPWLLRFFDQIRFYPVNAGQLLRHREQFLTGKFRLRMEEQTLRLKDYQAFLARNSQSIEAFRLLQRAAQAGERERSRPAGQDAADAGSRADAPAGDVALPPGRRFVRAHLPASVWQVAVKEGAVVKAGDKLLILESMKMETAISAPVGGRVERLLVAPGDTVEAGQALAVLVERQAES